MNDIRGEFLWMGDGIVPTSTTFRGAGVGLSIITYDARRRPYYTLVEEQDNVPSGDPVRYCMLDIETAD